MKILIDMNVSPVWVQVLQGRGWEAVLVGHRSPLCLGR